MLFIIEDEIVEAKDANFLKCFENLLLGYIEGNHLLFIKPSTVEKIETIYGTLMDERMKAQFVHYQEKFMIESKVAYNLVNYAIKIVPQEIEEKKVKYRNKTIGYLHTDKFLTSANVQKTVLLCENTSDGKIYTIFSKEFLKYKNSNLKVKLKIENGGGNTTAPTFKSKIDQNEDLCLCILDSDKKYPGDSSLGETSQRVKRETSRSLTPKNDFIIIEEARELENILPEGFYYKKYSEDVNKEPIFNKLDSLRSIDKRLIFFLDMKKGLKHYDIRKFTELSCITHDRITYNSEPICSTEEYCRKRDDCNCRIIEGFGNNILSDFIKFYNNSHQEIELIINSSDIYFKKIWLYISKLIFSWGCGQDISLANT